MTLNFEMHFLGLIYGYVKIFIVFSLRGSDFMLVQSFNLYGVFR